MCFPLTGACEDLKSLKFGSHYGPVGFEPMTFSLEGPHRRYFDINQYREYCYQKYSIQFASMQFQYSMRYFDYIENPSKILALTPSKSRNVLKAMVCLSKY